MKLDDDIHNYYEHLILERIEHLGLEKTKSTDYIADLCCLALKSGTASGISDMKSTWRFIFRKTKDIKWK